MRCTFAHELEAPGQARINAGKTWEKHNMKTGQQHEKTTKHMNT
jgi:hypothetical protein